MDRPPVTMFSPLNLEEVIKKSIIFFLMNPRSTPCKLNEPKINPMWIIEHPPPQSLNVCSLCYDVKQNNRIVDLLLLLQH